MKQHFPRPDIILIMTDQQRADTIGALGHPHMATPTMDRLVREGRAFTRAYCPGATCVASRAALFTGQYAHNTGAHSFFNWGHQRTWVEDLADAGYFCASIGKMHFQPRDVRGGFHDRVVVENPTSITNWGGFGDDDWGRYLKIHGYERPNYRHRTDPDWHRHFQCVPWHLHEHLHSDVFVGESAVQWIRHHEDERPLFLQVGFPGPHEPWDPLPRHLERYAGKELPPRVTRPGELDEKPPQHRAMQRFFSECDHEAQIQMADATEEDVDRMRRHYYAKISLVDEQIGRVLDELEAAGRLENALVLLCSDHGELLGDHQLAYKWLMYEPVVRVPFVAWGNGVAEGIDPSIVSLIDIGPTVLDWAGVEVPTRLEGGSLAATLREGEPGGRTAAYSEDNYQIMRVEERYKMVYHIGQDLGELYDLEADPHELFNRWGDPDFAAIQTRIQGELLNWLARSTYWQSGHRCGESDTTPRRWPNAGDAALHGENFLPRPDAFL